MMIIFYYLAPIWVISCFFLDWFGVLMILIGVGLDCYFEYYKGRPNKYYTASGKCYCMEAGEYIKVMDHETDERLYLLDRAQEGEDVNLNQFYTQQLCNANMAYQQGQMYNRHYTANPLTADDIIEVSDTCAKLEKLPKT